MIVITGRAGFIGSAVIRHIINKIGHSVVNVDKLTYSWIQSQTGRLINYFYEI